jgi:hypothetical protein
MSLPDFSFAVETRTSHFPSLILNRLAYRMRGWAGRSPVPFILHHSENPSSRAPEETGYRAKHPGVRCHRVILMLWKKPPVNHCKKNVFVFCIGVSVCSFTTSFTYVSTEGLGSPQSLRGAWVNQEGVLEMNLTWALDGEPCVGNQDQQHMPYSH